MALLVLPGMITFVVTLIPSYFGRNCLILSLFLTLCMAFAYVIALYIVYMKIDERGNSESGKVKNRTIALIYGARTAVRMGLLLFVLAECSRQLMLKRYTVIAISIPLLLACLYMGSRGTRGMVRFAESVFWFAVAAGAVVILSSVSNLDLSVLKTVTEIGDEGGANLTISRVMARGGLLFLGFSAMETVMLVYIHVIRRRRGMLSAAVGTSTIIGIMCSIIVICTLGTGALMAKEKNILYIVGAMELPGGVKLRPLMLVCYLVRCDGTGSKRHRWMGRCGQTGCSAQMAAEDIVGSPCICRMPVGRDAARTAGPYKDHLRISYSGGCTPVDNIAGGITCREMACKKICRTGGGVIDGVYIEWV